MAKAKLLLPTLSVDDTFKSYSDICNKLFDAEYKQGARQRYGHAPKGFKKHFSDYGLWCPILSENGRPYKQWLNLLEDSGRTIIEQNTDSKWTPDPRDKKKRVVFGGRTSRTTGKREYVFLGVFERTGTKVIKGRKAARYKRVATKI